MAIRVLGYRSVVEAKGTWPTNYIAKAQELNVLDDVEYKKYTDGATRGNVALLMWNMLRTNMWDVNSENESNGLNYTKMGTMIDKYFEDYTYATVKFNGVSINNDNEVIVDLDDTEYRTDAKVAILKASDGEYKYLENDFYKFVVGTEVEVLVNEEDEELLMMVPTGVDKLIEGTKAEIDEDYDDLVETTYDYAYGMVKSKKIIASTKLDVVSEYIYEVDTESSSKSVKFNDDSSLKFNYEDSEEDDLIIVNGERGTVKDIEEGDILSKVTIIDGDEKTDNDVIFYVVAKANDVEGKLTKIVEETYENTDKTVYYVATIGQKEYELVDEAIYFEDPESDDEPEVLSEDWGKDMKGEEVVAKLDFTGKIIAVEFDGNIGDEDEEYTVGFYAMTNNVDMKNRRYIVDLENEDGSDTYTFAKSYTEAKDLYLETEKDYAGNYVFVTFNDDSEIVNLEFIGNADDKAAVVDDEFTYDDNETEDEIDDKKFSLTVVTKATFDDEESEITGANDYSVRVNKDLVVVTLIKDDKGTENYPNDDEYSVTFTDGLDAIENLKNEDKILVIKDDAKNFSKAKYVVLFDEISNKEDNLFGLVDSIYDNKLGVTMITVKEYMDDEDGVDYILDDDRSIADLKALNIEAILYSIEENDDGEYELTIIREFKDYEFKLDYELHGYIAKSENRDNPNVSSDGREAKIYNPATDETKEFNLDSASQMEDYEDSVIVLLEVTEDEDVDTQYRASSYKLIDLDSAKLKELDRISFVENDEGEIEAVVIIRGMAAIPTAE